MSNFVPSPAPARAASARIGLVLLLVGLLAVGAVLLVPRLLSSDEGESGGRGSVVLPEADVEAPEPELRTPVTLVVPTRPEVTPGEPPREALDEVHDALEGALGANMGALIGRLLDAQTGQPISVPITVRLASGREPADLRQWERLSPQRFIGTGGEFRLGAHPKGHYFVRFEVDGYDPKVVELDLPMERAPRIALERGLWVHGTVTDAFGSPVEEMELTLVPEGGPNGFEQTTSTGPDGTYFFRGMDAGSWRVEVSGLQGVEEIPSSQTLTLSEATPEGIWDARLPKLTVVDLKVAFDRLVMRDPVATLASRKGARITTRVRGDKAHFAAVPPGFYDLTIGNPDGGEPWFYEWVEIPASDTPVVLTREVAPPRRDPVAARGNAKPSPEQREFLRERMKGKGKEGGKGKKKDAADPNPAPDDPNAAPDDPNGSDGGEDGGG